MKENRLHALAEFLKVLPESIKLRGMKHQPRFSVIDSGQRISGKLPINTGEQLELKFDFDPEIYTIVSAFCSCREVRRGAICEHICGLASYLVDDHFSGPSRGHSLEFLDKHLNSPSFFSAQFQLAIELEETASTLEPVIRLHKFIREGTFGNGRRFTANDSYKFTQGEPVDQNLLDYIRNFRQVFFYSNYEASQRYSWGFWISLIGHPRVSFKNRPVQVSAAKPCLVLSCEGDQYRLTVDYGEAVSGNLSFYEISGGLLAFCSDQYRLLVCQIDQTRCDILMDIDRFQPILARSDMVANLPRLEKLQKFFDFQLPSELSGIIERAEPGLVLQIDFQLGKGFFISPRAAYPRSDERLIPGSPGQYISSEGDFVIERDIEAEVDCYQAFLELFPYEEKPDKNHQIVIHDLERTLALIDWMKEQESFTLEWLRREPKIQPVHQVRGLRVQIDSKAWLKIHLMADDQTFSLSHFPEDDQHLAGSRFMAVDDGQWLQIDDQLRRQINRIKMAVSHEKKAMKLKKAALAMLADMTELSWEGDQTWLDQVDEWRGANEDRYTPSKKLKADLRKYQVEGYRWLRRMSELGVGACLADDMGLGKTVQALAVLLDRADKGPTLVVAPASVGFNWREEIERFTPSLKPVMYAEGRRSKNLSKLKNGEILVVSYALVLKDIERLREVAWGTLILDEAQFVKNALSQTAIAVSKLRREWTLALTGTPLENHLGELWSIFRMLNADLLGSWDSYRKTYVTPIEKNKDPQKLESLRRLIKPFILRRTKQTVLEDLPARSDIILKVELGDAQRAKYEGERNRILSQLDELDEQMRFKLLAAITRLRQLACHPALCEEKYKGESAKLKLFSELVEELVSESHRVLVFSQFTSFLALIARELNRIHVPHVMMTGETPVRHRQAIIRRFQNGEVPVFLVSLRAGGTGLNLTHANYVIHMDPWWNPAVEEQATDRAHRIGQTQAVTVYRLVATHTIEEAILNIHSRKKDLVHSLLEGQESSGKLSIGDLLSLIRTGQPN